MRAELHAKVLDRLKKHFDTKIIQNDLRGMYVEELVAVLLGDQWRSTGGNWAGWDLEHADGTRLEVKQSSAKQTWETPKGKKLNAVFSIRSPALVWDGAKSSVAEGRQATIYVFAWHGEESDIADHRMVEQWEFIVVPAAALPKDQKTISLGPLRNLIERELATSASAGELYDAVENIRLGRHEK